LVINSYIILLEVESHLYRERSTKTVNAREFRESVEDRLARLERAVYQDDIGAPLETDTPASELEQRVKEFMESCTVRYRRNPEEHSKRRSDTIIRQDGWRAFIQWATENNHDIVTTLGKNTFYKAVVALYHLPLMTTYNKDAWAGRRFNLEGKSLLDRSLASTEGVSE